MTIREQLIKEIEQAPDALVEEVLNFCLFVKSNYSADLFRTPNEWHHKSARTGQRDSSPSSSRRMGQTTPRRLNQS
jgi:hypothetical protein